MNNAIISPEQIASDERLDAGFYVHKAVNRRWTVPLESLSTLAEIRRRDRVEDPPDGVNVHASDGEAPSLRPSVNRLDDENDRSYFQWVEPGDVILNRSEPGRCFYVQQRMLSSYDYWVIQCEDPLKPEFLAIVLSSQYMQEEMERRSTGHVRARISREELLELHIPLPEGPKQEQVVASYLDETREHHTRSDVLDAVSAFDDQLGFEQQEVDARFVLSPSELEDRLDPWNYRSPSHKYTGSWPLKTIGEVADVSLGGRTSGKEAGVTAGGETQPVINTDHLDALLLRLDGETAYEPVGPDDSVAETGDLILSRYLTGQPTIAVQQRDEAVILGRRLIVIRPYSDVYPFYMGAYLLTSAPVSRMYHICAPSSGRKRMSVDDFKGLPVPVPPHETQVSMVEELEAIHHARRAALQPPKPENELTGQFIESDR